MTRSASCLVLLGIFLTGCNPSKSTTEPTANSSAEEIDSPAVAAAKNEPDEEQTADAGPVDQTASAEAPEIHGGKSLDGWITQLNDGPTLEDRQNALQVLRNIGLQHDRERTLAVFTKALSDSEPTVQSLAAAGLKKAGQPTHPQAPAKLLEIVTSGSIDKNPSTKTNVGLMMRILGALGEVGESDQVPALRSIAEDGQVDEMVRKFATDTIAKIETRSNEKQD